MKSISEIHDEIGKMLPTSVYLYIGRPKLTGTRVIFTDWDYEKVYFDKIYPGPHSYDELYEMIAKDAKDFTSRWNSPLMKALK